MARLAATPTAASNSSTGASPRKTLGNPDVFAIPADRQLGEWLDRAYWEYRAKQTDPETYAFLKEQEAQGQPVYSADYQYATRGKDLAPLMGANTLIGGALGTGAMLGGRQLGKWAGAGLGASMGATLGPVGAVGGGLLGLVTAMLAERRINQELGLTSAGGGPVGEQVVAPLLGMGAGKLVGKAAQRVSPKVGGNLGNRVGKALGGKSFEDAMAARAAARKGVLAPSSPIGIPEQTGASWVDVPWEQVVQNPKRFSLPTLSGDVPPPKSWAEMPRTKVRPQTKLSLPVQEGTPSGAERGALLRGTDAIRNRRILQGAPEDPTDVLGSPRAAQALREQVVQQRQAALQQLMGGPAPLPPLASETAMTNPWEVYLESMIDQLAKRPK